jgi:alkanesulfonate monooxygenase SsuD/methylene tetrahydromethanopterin reductase-like flavin-dependent oxidoreductase (luciferase family)
MRSLGTWAREAERAGFDSVGVIDRLVYDNLDPLTALAAAAVSTSRVELMTTIANVCWRDNAVLLAKQLSSVRRLSGGRLTAGLGMGGSPADYEASGVPLTGRGARFETDLSATRAAADRDGQPRIATGRYFSLGATADKVADAYVRHYYDSEFFPPAPTR